MEAPKPSELSLVYADEQNVLTVFRNALVQVRRGPINKAIFDRIAARTRLLQRAHPAGIGMLVVLEPDAPIPDAELRAHQTAMLKEMTARGRVCTAVVLLGSGVTNDLRRVAVSATRTIANVSEQRMESSVPDGARWLAQILDTPDAREFAAALEKCVETIRERYFGVTPTR